MASPMKQGDIQAKIAAGRARRKQEALKAKAKDSDEDGAVDPEKPAPVEKVSTAAYLGLFLGSAFFLSLPLGEEQIDWTHVGAVVVMNAVWIAFIHAPSVVYGLTWFLLNCLLIQWSLVFSAVPEIIAAVPPVVWAVGGVSNAVVVAAAYFLHIAKLPPAKRLDAWDLFACALIGANVVVLVIAGVIPMSVVYHVFKSLVNLLTNFSVS